MRRLLPLLVPLLLALLACNILTPATPTPTAAVPPASPTRLPTTPTPSATAPATDTPAPSETPAPSATETTAAPANAFVAYVDQGQLLVTDVTGGVKGGTTQYTQAGVDDQAGDLVWSPSGEFVAFTSSAGGEPRLFYVYAVGAGTPVDVGPGAVPAWSPDSTRLAYQQGGNLWVVTIDNPQPQQLTHEDNWAWGRPAWTPDGQSLVVTGTSFDNMGASGNTSFWLYSLPLDGSGSLTQLPGQAAQAEGRLPQDLRFSPDGQRLSFSTSIHFSACASTGAFYLANADGSDLHELPVPSLDSAANPDQEIYATVWGYDWLPDSSAVMLAGVVRNCKDFAGNVVAAELARVSLDGQELWTVPGLFSLPSVDHAGRYVAVTLSPDSGPLGTVQIYTSDGQSVLVVGLGGAAQMQP